mmetsp:Transcript_4744/g.11056  ORF Transcript_4744/g.11056 Transcript_4744/m.11056 type:complete len:254 (-) Transcript_4744:361-1122(-)
MGTRRGPAPPGLSTSSLPNQGTATAIRSTILRRARTARPLDVTSPTLRTWASSALPRSPSSRKPSRTSPYRRPRVLARTANWRAMSSPQPASTAPNAPTVTVTPAHVTALTAVTARVTLVTAVTGRSLGSAHLTGRLTGGARGGVRAQSGPGPRAASRATGRRGSGATRAWTRAGRRAGTSARERRSGALAWRPLRRLTLRSTLTATLRVMARFTLMGTVMGRTLGLCQPPAALRFCLCRGLELSLGAEILFM